MFFSGTPLLPDPGSQLFYLPNIIFLILPINNAFLISIILHTFFGGLGAYLAARKGFGFSNASSIFIALFYMTFPRTAGFLEAGHFVFITMTTWLPFLLLSVMKLTKSPKFGWSILLAVSLSGLFYSFTTVFIMVTITSGIYLLTVGSFILYKFYSIKTLIFSILGIVLTAGLCAVTLLPQLEWLPYTTRFILLQDRDVYPQWNGKIEFIQAMFPQISGINFTQNLDSEKWIATGIFISILALIGFCYLKRRMKVLIFTVSIIVILISLNNTSPVQSLLLSSDWYVLGRVSTRVWFIMTLILVFLAGLGIDRLKTVGLKKLTTILAILAVCELIFLSWVRIDRPIPVKRDVPPALLDFLKISPEKFRIFCVTRCISQQDIARYNLETIEGYGTIYQKNYYKYFIQLSQVFWDKYTPTLPPISIYEFREIQPIALTVADHNVKYVISPYKLKDLDFKLVKQFDNLLVFENTKVRARAYFVTRGSNSEIEAPIDYYSANKIVVDTSKQKAKEVVLAETWSPGWTAYLNGNEEVSILETPSTLRKVEINPSTKFVEFKYESTGFKIGRIITFTTWSIISLYLVLRFIRRKNNSQ